METGVSFNLMGDLELKGIQTLQSRCRLCSGDSGATCLMMAQGCRDGGRAKGCPTAGSKGCNAFQILSTSKILSIP